MPSDQEAPLEATMATVDKPTEDDLARLPADLVDDFFETKTLSERSESGDGDALDDVVLEERFLRPLSQSKWD
jgi:hypothetical protein